MSATHKPLVFSGMQPTGNIHLGNYLGAIKNWIPMQKEKPCIFCVVDMHSLTVWVDPKELRNNTRMIAAALASLVVSPVVFLGSALLYVDQEARLRSRGDRPKE